MFKAFDNVNIYGLLNIMMVRQFPRIFINIMHSWVSKCFGTVRWASCFSTAYSVTDGVRQGGLLGVRTNHSNHPSFYGPAYAVVHRKM